MVWYSLGKEEFPVATTEKKDYVVLLLGKYIIYVMHQEHEGSIYGRQIL